MITHPMHLIRSYVSIGIENVVYHSLSNVYGSWYDEYNDTGYDSNCRWAPSSFIQDGDAHYSRIISNFPWLTYVLQNSCGFFMFPDSFCWAFSQVSSTYGRRQLFKAIEFYYPSMIFISRVQLFLPSDALSTKSMSPLFLVLLIRLQHTKPETKRILKKNLLKTPEI